MASASSSFGYRCRSCDEPINVVAAAQAAKRRRDERRAAKAGRDAPDPAYRAWVAGHPCLRCGAPPPSHPHHSVHKSQGGSDRSCVPLCFEHHGEYHDRLGSVPAALAAWGIDLRAEARRLSAAYGAPDDDGPELPL